MSPKEIPTVDLGYKSMSEIPPEQLEVGISKSTIEKLVGFEQILLERGEQGLLDWLRNNAEGGVKPLAEQIGLSNTTLRKFYDHLGIPRPTLAEVNKRMWEQKWQDPDFVERHAEWSRKSMEERWQDENFRLQQSEALTERWKDPEFREERSEDLRNKRQDPEFNEKMSQAINESRQDPNYKEGVSKRVRKMWEDPNFRQRQAEMMRRVYADPEYGNKIAEGLRNKFEDTEWLSRRAEATRKARLNPETIDRYRLPTIQGERNDLGFYTQSAWEANIARVLMYCKRDFYMREAIKLTVPFEYQQTFPTGMSEISVDFITLDPRNNLLIYEIMAHPQEDPTGWMKLELLINQYPNLRVRPIIPKFYNSIRRHFEKRINSDPRFAGWESHEDNLRNNPEKYALVGI